MQAEEEGSGWAKTWPTPALFRPHTWPRDWPVGCQGPAPGRPGCRWQRGPTGSVGHLHSPQSDQGTGNPVENSMMLMFHEMKNKTKIMGSLQLKHASFVHCYRGLRLYNTSASNATDAFLYTTILDENGVTGT